MGARPLKRAIDQYVIAPLAAAIVERRFPEGDQFVFVKSDGTAIQAEFVDPDGDGEPVLAGAAPTLAGRDGLPPSLGSMILAASGSETEIDVLTVLHEGISERLASPEWSERKARLAADINVPEFWADPKRFLVLSRLELMDRLEVAADTAASLQARVAKRRNGAAHGSRELIARLAMQVHLVREGLKDLDTDAPVEAVVTVEPALEGHGSDRAAAAVWAREILDMYRAWARKRNMQLGEIDRVKGLELPAQAVAGFGAYRLLMREAGLHVLEQVETPSGAGGGRIAVRVTVTSLPAGDPSRINRRAALTEALGKGLKPSGVVRRYRRHPTPLVRDVEGSWRTGRNRIRARRRLRCDGDGAGRAGVSASFAT